MYLKVFHFILSIVTLFVGGIIYLTFRSKTLFMFTWVDKVGLNEMIDILRQMGTSLNLPYWIIYALPDGLWLFSYMLLINLIWDNQFNGTYKFWLYLLPTVAILSEFLQILIPALGTFDVWDLICYVGAVLMFILIK